jgi:hypothetical protein
MTWQLTRTEDKLKITCLTENFSHGVYRASISNQDLLLPKDLVPSVNLDSPMPAVTLIQANRITVYENKVDMAYNNPLDSRSCESGRVQKLICRVVDYRLINQIAAEVFFPQATKSEVMNYMVFSEIDYKLYHSEIEGFPKLFPKDKRHAASSLDGAFSEEMEEEFRKLSGQFPSFGMDMEHCLEFLRKRRKK